MTAADATLPEVTASEAAARVERGAMLLDVREPEEWEAGHAAGAVWIPLGTLGDRVGEVPAGQAVVCVCRIGGRSAKATEFLLASGRDAVNLIGGMQAWAASGLPVETDAGTPGDVV